MALWTDIIDPATLTGYARAALADYEEQRGGSLARWLPNRTIADVVARFVKGSTGLIDVARFRAYDAEIEIGRRPQAQRVTLELPALGVDLPVSEYEQLRARGGSVSDAQALASIQNVTRMAVRSAADAMERLRGIVLETGVATIDQDNFQSADDFGRPAGQTITAPALWSVAGTDALGQLETWADVVLDATGEAPGAIVMSTRAFRALGALDQFRTTFQNGGERAATANQVREAIGSAGLPDIYLYDRRVSVNGVNTKVVSDDRILLLPMPVGTDEWEATDLGASFWGRTLSSTEPGWGIEDAEQPGIVAGVFRNEKPPMGIEVISDAIGQPVLANANRSMAVKVL